MKTKLIEYVERRGTNCYKWDSDNAKDTLPLWVADMDFKAAPAIINAIQKRLDHGVFGYQYVPDEYYQSIILWFEKRHRWKGIKRENIIYTTGVVPAISAILRAMTTKGDKVLTLTPAYNCFFSSIRNLDCSLLASPLVPVNNHYEIDWNDFEEKAKQAKIFLLCNPHNPTGRVWTKEELIKMGQICDKYGVFVISDEIHCEFTFPSIRYTPFATAALSDNYCVCTSASKAFNIAGLQCANIFVPDKKIYEKIDKGVNIHENCDINPFGMVALMAAYNESEAWLDELQLLIYDNYLMLCSYIAENLPALQVTKMEGTYLSWVNIAATGIDSLSLCNMIKTEEKVLFNPSEMYGAEDYIRINIATSEQNILTALNALKSFVKRHNI